MRRLLVASLTTATALILLAPAVASAHDNGQGLYGETNDKVVTNAGFLLILVFPLFILLMSIAQAQLDKRKEARKAVHEAHEAAGEPRGGW